MLVRADARYIPLADATVDCVISSPPYYGLRQYAVDGPQIGQEQTWREYLDALVAVARECWRVLKPTGVMFWNLGDSYADDRKWGGSTGGRHGRRLHGPAQGIGRTRRSTGLPAKSLMLVPERLAIALSDEGWTVRNVIAWCKPNGMPSPVQDRFSCQWEFVWFFAKSSHPWFDLEAVRQPYAAATIKRGPSIRQISADGELRYHGLNRQSKQDGTGNRQVAGLNERFNGADLNPAGRNPGDWWVIPTFGFPDAHYAVFPPELVLRCLLVGCPPEVCRVCGKPRRRIVLSKRAVRDRETRTVGWSDCGCGAGFTPGLVLDPFMGSGTTGLVAERHGRRWVGLDLGYHDMARQRTRERGFAFAEAPA
jgi:DNA modification methylase